MKKRFTYILMTLAAAVAFSSCKKEVEDIYVPAQPESADCMDVFFPPQDASGDHQLDPTAPTQVTIKVSRPEEKSKEAATVKYTLSETKDGEPVQGVFEADEITFAAGQAETTFTLKFDKTDVGIPYSCTVALEEGAYASAFSSGATQLKYSVTRVKWNLLEGKGLWRDDLIAGVMAGYVVPANPVWEVDIYERDDLPGMYRVVGVYTTEHITGWLDTDFKEYNEGCIDDLIIEVDATNPKKVWIPYMCIGWQFYSNGPFYIGQLVDENLEACPDINGYTSSDNYGTNNNGLITFPTRALCYGFSAEEWWGRANTNGMQYIALPGVAPVDYSIKLASGLTQDGVAPVQATVGMDVEKIKYAVYEGELNAAQANKRVEAILAGTDAASEFSDLTPNKAGSAKVGVMGLTPEATGDYTLVAITYDKDGKAHDSASVLFTYVSAEEPVPVEINCGLSKTGKYEPQGFTTENSLEFYVYGENIVDAKVGWFKTIDIMSKGESAIAAAVKTQKSISAEALELLNGDGYVDVATGLTPGTEFYLFVWASNGYEETVICSNPVTTDGDPLPIYMDYTTDDYYADGAFANAAEAIGTWNYYGTDAYGDLGMREYLGEVKISASETPSEGPDDYGLYDEYVYVEGLFGDLSWLAGYGMSDKATVEMDVYDGIIYYFGKTVVEGNYNIYQGAKATNQWGYSQNYWSAFIPVADGYYAFVDVDSYGYAASYNFCGIGLADPDAGWIAKIWDPLLVDPAKDDNGVAPAGVSAAANQARKLMNDVAIQRHNFVETGKGRIQSIIDGYSKAVRVYGTPAGLKGLELPHPQANVTVVSLGLDKMPKAETPKAPAFLPREAR